MSILNTVIVCFVVFVLIYIVAIIIVPSNNVPDMYVYGTWINEDKDVIIIRKNRQNKSELILAIRSDVSGEFYTTHTVPCSVRKTMKLLSLVPGATVDSFKVKTSEYTLHIEADVEDGLICVEKDDKYLGYFAKNTIPNLTIT